jgi:hypothetical protein
MCDCIQTWIPDPKVVGSHSVTPVTCAEYIEALETVLLRTQGHTSDSLDLRDPQRTVELLSAAEKIKNPLLNVPSSVGVKCNTCRQNDSVHSGVCRNCGSEEQETPT